MNPDQEPEIKNINQDSIILKIMGLGVKMQDFPLIDRPGELEIT